MSRVTPEQFQEKHARRLKEALPDMERGVNAVTESPTAKAAKSIGKLRTNLLAAIDSGKMERRMKAVTLEDWKGAMLNKGLGRVATGIDGAKDKTIAFATQLLPHIDKVVSEVKKLPDLTIEDSVNRAATFIRGMAKFEKK